MDSRRGDLPPKIYPQRHRGSFGEFARRDEGVLARIGLWPMQWAAARMFADTAKGFHIHPPSVPEGTAPGAWFRRCFIDEPENYSLRRYDHEQWDVMFFTQGDVEMILRDERAGMLRARCDSLSTATTSAARTTSRSSSRRRRARPARGGLRNDIMVYGTSTIFDPEFEGRIATTWRRPLPEEWAKFLAKSE